MHGHIKYQLILISIFIFALHTSLLYSAEWRISPIRVELNNQDKSSSITVFNEDKAPINFQVYAKKWEQDENGKDFYTDTDELIFFPRVFTIEPGKERLIRVGVKKSNPAKESTYRLFIEEIPSSDKKGGVAVQIALRFGVPIFIKPAKESIQWNIKNKSVEGGNFILELENKGNQHFNILSINLKGEENPSTQKEVFKKEIKGWYILPGAKRIFKEKIENCSNLKILYFQIISDKFTYDDKILLTENNCINP